MLFLYNFIGTLLFFRPLVHATRTIVPLYVYPSTDTTWEPLETAVQETSVEAWAIVNPSSGPGSTVDGQYTSGILSLLQNGISAIGYVATDYAGLDIDEVKGNIDTWKTLYPNVTGIFVDQMPPTYSPDVFAYYKNLSDYITEQGYEFTVGNPGMAVDDARLLIFNTTVIYEEAKFPKQRELKKRTSFPGYDIPIERFAVLAYNVSCFDCCLVAKAQNRVGYIFIQNVFAEYPWNSLARQHFMTEQFEQYAEDAYDGTDDD